MFYFTLCLFHITFVRHAPFFNLVARFLQMNVVLRPSRIRHNGDTGADVQ